MILLLLLLLGLLTYYIVQRSVAGITRTPVWILWLVMMMPAFILIAWDILHQGKNQRMPLELMVGTVIICLPLYWFLVQWGRRPGNSSTLRSSELQPQEQTAMGSTANPLEKAPVNPEKQSALRPINKAEEATLQNCFPWSIYYLQTIDYRPQAVICRGQLRTNAERAYETVQENVKAHFGDRFLVIFQEGLNGKPFFVLVPNPQAQEGVKSEQALTRPGLATTLLLLTLLTTTFVGTEISGTTVDFSPEFLQRVLTDPAILAPGIPYSLALLTILGIHELGHYLAARYYKLRATLPYFIPVPLFLGTLGAFIQIRSPIPNRKVLFDVGIAGPLTGLIATIPILLWGLAHSTVVPLPPSSQVLDFGLLNPNSFLMVTVLSKLALGSQLAATNAIKMHPVALAGCLGLVVTALNLMPVGQLDGGHIVHAMFGQRVGVLIGQLTRMLVLLASLVLLFLGQSDSQLLLWSSRLFFWAILLFFMPIIDEPALNDVSELDNRRDFLGLVALALLVMIVLPTPAIVARAIL